MSPTRIELSQGKRVKEIEVHTSQLPQHILFRNKDRKPQLMVIRPRLDNYAALIYLVDLSDVQSFVRVEDIVRDIDEGKTPPSTEIIEVSRRDPPYERKIESLKGEIFNLRVSQR